MQAYEDNESFILMIPPPPYKFIKICDIPMLSLPHCLLIALPKHPSCPVSSMENQFQGPKLISLCQGSCNLNFCQNILQKFCVETDLPFYFFNYRNNLDVCG